MAGEWTVTLEMVPHQPLARVERLCVSSCRPATVEMRLRSSKLEVTPKAASGTPVGPRKGEQAKC